MSATEDFIKSDFGSTLFPLKTNLLMAEKHAVEINQYIYQRILDEDIKTENFLPQQRVYATKPHGHLRRTSKLDPVAEYFLYDVTYRNRSIFRQQVSDVRRSFGYRFKGGGVVSIHSAYGDYKQALKEAGGAFKHSLKFDIASYFNSLYHHDVCHWFAACKGVSDVDANALGKFFREINAGRSVDFLPHGIYPSKMIGNEFLKYVDQSAQVKSGLSVRFMDDFTLFDDDPEILQQDFICIQQLLGQYGLNVNPSKTHFDKKVVAVEDALSIMSASLMEIVSDVKEVVTASSIDMVEVEFEIESPLNESQVKALLVLLRDDALEESDADQILGFLRSHSDDILEHIPGLLRRFPNLAKHIYSFCGAISEKAELSTLLLEFLNEESFFLEYQLFWIACIVEDHLLGHGCYGDLLMKLYELTPELRIARAKVLEIPELGYGFKEIRDQYLKTGQSDWLSWASAMGSRSLKAGERNYVLDYFSKGSPMNFLVANCAKKF
jgi:hypothetical protein